MKKSAILCTALLATTSLSYGASLNSLHKDQVKKALVDKTITTAPVNRLNDQVTQTPVVVYLDNNGNISGQFMNTMNSSTTTSMNNTTNNMPSPQSDTGTYKLKNNGLLCITWKTWNKGNEFCVYTYETSNAYLFVDDHHVFHTVAMKSDIQSGNQMNMTNGSTTTTTTPNNNMNNNSNMNNNNTNNNNNNYPTNQ